MTKPSSRFGHTECRPRPAAESASRITRLRRHARPAKLAIVIGSLLAVMTVHTIWSKCAADGGAFVRLSDSEPAASPERGRVIRITDETFQRGGEAATAVMPASYLTEQRDSASTTGAPVVAPKDYRPKLQQGLRTADGPEVSGASDAPRLIPMRPERYYSTDGSHPRALPDVLIAPPESIRRVTTITPGRSPSHVPSVPIGISDNGRRFSPPGQGESIPPPADSRSDNRTDDSRTTTVNSIRLADPGSAERNRPNRPTRWKIEARLPAEEDPVESESGEFAVIKQESRSADEDDEPSSTISLRLRDDPKETVSSRETQSFAPDRYAPAVPATKAPRPEEPTSSMPLREVLPIRWTIGGPSAAPRNDVAQPATNAVSDVTVRVPTSSADAGLQAASETDTSHLRFAPSDVISSPPEGKTPQSSAPPRKTGPGWLTQTDDPSSPLRLVYEEPAARHPHAVPAKRSAPGPALRLVDKTTPQLASDDERLPGEPTAVESPVADRSDGQVASRADGVPVIRLGTSDAPVRRQDNSNTLSTTGQPEEPTSDLADAAVPRTEEPAGNALSATAGNPNAPVKNVEGAEGTGNRWVAVSRPRREWPADDPPPQPPSQVLTEKTPNTSPPRESLAKRFTKNTIGWKIVKRREDAPILADAEEPGRQPVKETLAVVEQPKMSVAAKDATPPSRDAPPAMPPSIRERWKLDDDLAASRLAPRFAEDQPARPPSRPSVSSAVGDIADTATTDLAPTFGASDRKDAAVLADGDPVVRAAREDLGVKDPADVTVPFAYDDGQQPPTRPRRAVWRSADDRTASETGAENGTSPVAGIPSSTRLAIVRRDDGATRPDDPTPEVPSTTGRDRTAVTPVPAATTQEGAAPPPDDVDEGGGSLPSTPPDHTPRFLVQGLAAKPITQVGIDITPPVDDSPLGSEFPDEVRLPSDPTGEAPPVDESFARGWAHSDYSWAATGLCHRPLYFEQVNLERYGYAPTRSRIGQSVFAGAHFFGSVLILPYRMGAEPINECTYTLGHYRPGSYVPYRTEWPPLDWKGGALETVTLVGLIFAIP